MDNVVCQFEGRIMTVKGDQTVVKLTDVNNENNQIIAGFDTQKLTEYGISGKWTRFKYILHSKSSSDEIISTFEVIEDIMETPEQAKALWDELSLIFDD